MGAVLQSIRSALGGGSPARSGRVPRGTPTPTAGTQEGLNPEQRLSGALAGLSAQIAEMSGGDPMTDSIIRGLLSQRMGVAIPTEQELALAQMQAQIQFQERRNTLTKLQVQEAHALMLDDPDGRLKQQGIDPQGLLDQPEQFVAIANSYGIALTLGDMKRAGVGAVDRTPGQRMASQLSQSAGNLANVEKVGERVQAAAEGEGALGEALVRRETAEGQRDGVTIKGFLGTDIDEGKGAQAFMRLYNGYSAEVGDLAGKPVAAQAFVERYGDMLRDQLEGQDRNPAGELIVGKGDLGVTDDATVFLALTVQRIAQDMGVSIDEAFSRLGLEYTGIDQQSLVESLTQVAPEAFREAAGKELQGARSQA